ncbi:unnamed protein product [Rotaria magnacalcarata]|uniref:RRM domain-containing protein n=1 Tax=Rotaria magnacalcarata TaxID=392030 RepID=A0A816WLP8_9BILA|nr:unnamed protein product [Rotaria magnacalcarata]CAF1618537.1 unnamed protein product [Rotaria magnacalcarata]CAF2135891.1 unnamed protein product [Rotaria magnacalcarata]CAF3752664.1 unnamed protein product [Rotaria magnacalcarata]CAF3785795.1 unnamed protein product [Rotaria magnacalcarata]
MSSNDLIDRKYYSLYIGNLSADIRRKELCQYLEHYSQVDECQLFEANHRRWTCFAFVLMRTPDSINRLMSTRPHYLDNRRLYLKRALPDQCSNKIEHFLTSESVLIHFKDLKNQEIHEPNFNDENIRNYFQTYGYILNLYLLKNNRCVIEYNDYDSVDCIILDSPHYFNSHELQIDKYYSTEQLKQLDRMFTHNHELPSLGAGEDGEQVEQFLHSRRYLNMRIRLLNDSIESVKISNEIKLETIHQGFLLTINRRKELLEQIKELNKQCQILHEKNEAIKENNQNRLHLNSKLEKNYQQQITDQQNKQIQWRQKIESLQEQT